MTLLCFAAVFTLFDLDNKVDITAVDTSTTCTEARSAPCKAETSHCYPRADTCVYDMKLVDESRSVEVQKTCRDGAHIRMGCGKIQFIGDFLGYEYEHYWK